MRDLTAHPITKEEKAKVLERLIAQETKRMADEMAMGDITVAALNLILHQDVLGQR